MKPCLTLITALIFISPLFGVSEPTQDHVILLHGLCRTKSSMKRMEVDLTQAGYRVWNIDYPSRTDSIEHLSESTLKAALEACRAAGATRIHFVTHSMGGILVRSYRSRHEMPDLGNVVMLGPPNQGSEVVDKLGKWRLFKAINGPAGQELTTASDSTPNKLGPVSFPLGVIAGSRSINWINSFLISGSDDGKVSIERTKVEGMSDHLVLKAPHPFLMKNREAIRQTIHFLKNGTFDH